MKTKLQIKQLRVSRFSPSERKSCPNCSAKAGRIVYREPYEFGLRMMPSGELHFQSWCNDCRSGS